MSKLCLPLLALGLIGFALRPGLAADETRGATYEECAKACSDCQRACDACATHCLRLVSEGKKDHLKTVRTCQDCATHCSAAACIVARKGPFADTICTACAEACKRCGDECAKFPDHAIMKKCADQCRECEKACREMLKHMAAK
jgi:hypothetical protein